MIGKLFVVTERHFKSPYLFFPNSDRDDKALFVEISDGAVCLSLAPRVDHGSCYSCVVVCNNVIGSIFMHYLEEIELE
jgi:hypothetical protein